MRVWLKKKIFSRSFGVVFSLWLIPQTQAMDDLKDPLEPSSSSQSTSYISFNPGQGLRESSEDSKPSLSHKIWGLVQDISGSLEQMTRLESRIQTLVLYHAGEISQKGVKASCPRLVMAMHGWPGLRMVKKAEETKYVLKKQASSKKYTDYLEAEKKSLTARLELADEVKKGLKKWVYATLKPEEKMFKEFSSVIDQWIDSVSLQHDTIDDLKVLEEMFPKNLQLGNEGELFSDTNFEIFNLLNYIFEESLIRRAQLLYERMLPVYLDLKSSVDTLRRFSQELKRENDVKDQLSKTVDEELKKHVATTSSSYWFSWKNSKIPHPKIDISPTILACGKFPPYKNIVRSAKRQKEERLQINADGPDGRLSIVPVQLERAELIEKAAVLKQSNSNEKVGKLLASSKILSALLEDIKSFRSSALCFGVICFKADAKGGALRKPAVRFAHHLMWTPGAFVRNAEKLPGEPLSQTLVRYFGQYEQLIAFYNENLKNSQRGYFSECLRQLQRNSTFLEKECPKGKVESSLEKEEREKENYRRQVIEESFFTTDYIEHWVLAHYTFRDESEKQYFIDSLMQHLFSLSHSPFCEAYFKGKSSNDEERWKVSVEAAKEILLFRAICEAIVLHRPIPKKDEHDLLQQVLFQKWWLEDRRVNEILHQVRLDKVSASILEEHKAFVTGIESLFRDILNKCLKLLRLDDQKIKVLTEVAKTKMHLTTSSQNPISSNRIHSSTSQNMHSQTSHLGLPNFEAASCPELLLSSGIQLEDPGEILTFSRRESYSEEFPVPSNPLEGSNSGVAARSEPLLPTVVHSEIVDAEKRT